MTDWHHSPVHRLKATGAYIITGATFQKQHYFSNPTSLDLFQSIVHSLAAKYGIKLEAWAIFSNHYHLIILTYPESGDLKRFIIHLHSETARELNKKERLPGRRIWYEFWDTQLTYRDSYFARLNYVMNNPVRHGLVDDAKNYPWCSAKWFADQANSGHYKTVTSYKIDQVVVNDDFDC